MQRDACTGDYGVNQKPHVTQWVKLDILYESKYCMISGCRHLGRKDVFFINTKIPISAMSKQIVETEER